MGVEQSPDEVLNQYATAMGEELGRVFYGLLNELVWLDTKWYEFKTLYVDREERVELLNRASGLFFGMIQTVLWEDILLHIARLTDRPSSAGKENLTFLRLPASVSDEALRQTLVARVESVGPKTWFARDWRNRRIAHRDLGSVLPSEAKPLPGIKVDEIDEALKSLIDILNVVNRHYLQATIYFGDIGRRKASLSMLHLLRDGVEVREARLSRLRSGQFLPEDVGPRPEI